MRAPKGIDDSLSKSGGVVNVSGTVIVIVFVDGGATGIKLKQLLIKKNIYLI